MEWKCPSKKEAGRLGNFIWFAKTQFGRWNTLEILDIQASYCKPKLKQCRCKSLLESLLELEVTTNRITGANIRITGSNNRRYIKGCECVFGAAAKQGFNFFRMLGSGEEFCRETKTLTVGKYVNKMCKYLLKANCQGGIEITRGTPPEVY